LESVCRLTPTVGSNPTLSARKLLLRGLMILRTVEQVRRIFLIIAGFTLLLVGIIMLVTPGPGLLVIFLGLGLLAAEFVWARRLMERIKQESGRVVDRFTAATRSMTAGEKEETKEQP
jgi:uncharacterized protein (TIGR02611 family)